MKHYTKIYDVHLNTATTGEMVVLCTGDTFLLYYTNKLLIVWVSCCVCVGLVSHGSPTRQPGEGVGCHEPWASTYLAPRIKEH